jgi:hypothetical protein
MLYAISLSKTVSLYVFVVELDHFGVKRCKNYRIRGSKTLTFLQIRFYTRRYKGSQQNRAESEFRRGT